MMDTNVDSKVQRIQAMLYVKASQEPDIQFRRLYKYLTRQEWVEAAIASILRNRGSQTAGIDGKTRHHYQKEKDRYALAEEIVRELKANTYKPEPVRRKRIAMPSQKKSSAS